MAEHPTKESGIEELRHLVKFLAPHRIIAGVPRQAVVDLLAERDALREALEEAADWLDNDLAHTPETPVSMADRELIARWRSVLDRTCP